MRKILKLAGLFAVLTGVGFGAFLLNGYLESSKRFPYATGTSEKAFLNATWKMSPQEIERADNAILLPYTDHFTKFGPQVLDTKRLTEFKRSDLMLWGQPAEVMYSFFDDRLYDYYISLKTYDTVQPLQEAIESLTHQFGQPKDTTTEWQAKYFEWHTERQDVSCWLNQKDPDGSSHIGVRASHKPFQHEINEIVAAEKKKYF